MRTFLVDVLRLCVWLALLAAVFTPLERLCALHPQKFFRKAFRTDLIYYFVSGLVPKLLLIVPITLLAGALHHWVPVGFYGWTAALPLWLRLTMALIIGEVGFYWGH